MSNESQVNELKEALNELETVNRILGRICRVSETNHIMSIIVEELVAFSGAAQGVINLVQKEDAAVSDTVVRDSGSRSDDERFVLLHYLFSQ